MVPSCDSTQKEEASVSVTVPFPCDRTARIVFEAVNATKEPPRSRCTKQFHVKDKNVFLTMTCRDLRNLRTGFNCAIDQMLLAMQTVNMFDNYDPNKIVLPSKRQSLEWDTDQLKLDPVPFKKCNKKQSTE